MKCLTNHSVFGVYGYPHTWKRKEKKTKLKKHHTQRQRHATERNEINKCMGTVEEIKTSFREKDRERQTEREREREREREWWTNI